MDVTPFLEILPAPRAIFDHLPERHARPRFMLLHPDGGWTPITWDAHARDIRNLALFVRSRGLQPGQRGAIFAPNGHHWLAAAMALEATGVVMVPIYPASTAAQAAYVIAHSQARVAFIGSEELVERVLLAWRAYEDVHTFVVLDDTDPARIAARLRETAEHIPTPDEIVHRFLHLPDALARGASHHADDPHTFERALRALDLDQPAIMLYTSGTTGHPKGVPLTHRNIGVHQQDWLRCNAPLLPDEGIDLFWLPMSHIFGFGEALFGNVLGWTSYLCEPTSVIACMPDVRPTVFLSVPTYWEKLATNALLAPDDATAKAALASATGGRLRFCLSGGAGLKGEVKALFHRAGCLVIEGYGLTETSPTLTMNRHDDTRLDNVGRPFPSVEVRLLEDGEIAARGPSVFSGYHDDPAATAAAFTDDGWFKTGDLGRFTEEGLLQIIGRKKEILVTAGGKNIPPGNVERLFASDPLFTHVVVYGDGKKYLTAGIWLDQAILRARLDASGIPLADRDTATGALVQQAVDTANAQLARFEQIKRFRIMTRPLTVEAGLLTSTLKLRRHQIYKAFHQDFESLYD